jgi:DNA-binding MarR family transcriptional regulator
MGNRQLKRTARQEPDFAILVVSAARSVADRLGAAVARAGIGDMRSPYGFVIRALHARQLTLTELADRLGVTKQAAIKVVDEMEQRGFVARRAHAEDRRAKLLELTPKGSAVRAAALAESHRIEDELVADLGQADLEAFRRVMLRFLEREGGVDDVMDGRARADW